jgi:hypothetical protein
MCVQPMPYTRTVLPLRRVCLRVPCVASRASAHGVIVEAGFSHTAFSQNLGVLGGGWMYGLAARSDVEGRAREQGWRIAVLAHAVMGESYDRVAVGARSGLAFGFWMYALEISHQVLWVDGHDHHELHLALTSLMTFGEDQ